MDAVHIQSSCASFYLDLSGVVNSFRLCISLKIVLNGNFDT